MSFFLIEKYIQKITKQDINTYANTQGIILTEEETNTIYYYIKNKYKEFFSGNQNQLLQEIKPKLNKKTYQKIEELYQIYKTKL